MAKESEKFHFFEIGDELKPCPFCGADEIEDWGEATWSQPAKWMYCTCCQAQGPRILMNRGEDLDVFMSRVKADWNQRYQPTEERQHDHPGIRELGRHP